MHLGAQQQRPKQQQQQREQQEKHQRRFTFSKGRQCRPCSVTGIYR